MPKTLPVLEIDRPHFTLRLYENLLKIDLKGSFKNEIEEALENKPVLKETIGGILGIFVPLHIPLRDIHSASVDQTGKVKIKLSLHRNIDISLERKGGERLVEKLNQLISKARQKNFELERLRRKRARNLKRKSKRLRPSSYATVPYYFPTEQVDNVGKLRPRKKGKNRSF
jgi:hypothetical protein